MRNRQALLLVGVAAMVVSVFVCAVVSQAQERAGRARAPGGLRVLALDTPLSDLESDVAALMLIRQLDLRRSDVLRIADILDTYAAVQASTTEQIEALAAGFAPTLEDLRETLLRDVDADGGAMAALAEFHRQVRELRAQEEQARTEALEAVAEVVWGPETGYLEGPSAPVLDEAGQGALPPAQPPVGSAGAGGRGVLRGATAQSPLMAMIITARRADDATYERRKQMILDRAAALLGEGMDEAAFRTEFGALLDEARAIPDDQRRAAWPGVAEQATALAQKYGIELVPPERPGGAAGAQAGQWRDGPPDAPWRQLRGRGLERLVLGDASRTASLLREYAQNLVEE